MKHGLKEDDPVPLVGDPSALNHLFSVTYEELRRLAASVRRGDPRALAYQQQNAEATRLIREALAIRERVYGPVHPMVASSINELGNIAVAEERYDEAEAHFRRMADIYRSAYGGKHYLMGTALSNLASVHTARGQYAS